MNSKIEPIIRYIFSLLLGGEGWEGKIAYARRVDETALITIQASDFFDEGIYLTERSLPSLPLVQWHGIPLLFGESKEEMIDGHMIIHADIIASSYFLISRYEELVTTGNRDSHGRFMGRGSLLGRAGFLERPVIDEYGKVLRDILRRIGFDIGRTKRAGKVYLTHDVDIPWKKWGFISALRNCAGYTRQERRPVLWPLRNFLGDYSCNPFDTFECIFELDTMAKKSLGDRCKDIYFVIAACKPDSYTENYIRDKKAEAFIERLKRQTDHIGLHISYEGGKTSDEELIRKEKRLLESKLKREVRINRNHYLLTKTPASFRSLISIGISDDYTMGYADRVGFRLGTAQCVRWIDAENVRLTELHLHPLIIMDSSFAEEQYMGLKKQEAIEKIREIYRKCQIVDGDFSVLFHNSMFMPGPYFWVGDVYQDLINMLIEDKRTMEII